MLKVSISWNRGQRVPASILAQSAETHLAMPTFLRASALIEDVQKLQRTRLAIRGIVCWTPKDYILCVAYSE